MVKRESSGGKVSKDRKENSFQKVLGLGLGIWLFCCVLFVAQHRRIIKIICMPIGELDLCFDTSLDHKKIYLT